MTSIRERHHGSSRAVWVVDYLDLAGKRHLKTFKQKLEAVLWASRLPLRHRPTLKHEDELLEARAQEGEQEAAQIMNLLVFDERLTALENFVATLCADRRFGAIYRHAQTAKARKRPPRKAQ
jgi:hypothetical protein